MRIKKTINLILLLIAILYLMILYVFLFQKKFANNIGKHAIVSYSESKTELYEKALMSMVSGDDDPAIQLLFRWGEVKKRDRIYHLKRQLLLKLCESLHEDKDFETMKIWSAEWVELDDRDVDAAAYYYDGLKHSGSQADRDVGEKGFADQFQRFSGNKSLQKLSTKHYN